MSIQYMTKIQKIPKLSLKCHIFHPGIHKDPSIGTQTLGCVQHSNGYRCSSWISKLGILG